MTNLKDHIAKTLLPLPNCCETGCKKCPYGRWLKHREHTWPILIDESFKRIPYWLWFVITISAYVAGRYGN